MFNFIQDSLASTSFRRESLFSSVERLLLRELLLENGCEIGARKRSQRSGSSCWIVSLKVRRSCWKRWKSFWKLWVVMRKSLRSLAIRLDFLKTRNRRSAVSTSAESLEYPWCKLCICLLRVLLKAQGLLCSGACHFDFTRFLFSRHISDSLVD